jgi:uncharacterized protein (TIGR03435 family)
MRNIGWIMLAGALFAQAQQFEVASMKVVPPGEPARQRVADDALLHYPSVSLLFLLREAFRLQTPEQVDGPGWMRSQLYDIEAKLPTNASKGQIPEMLQALLADRLKLSVHHEMRPLPTDVLLVSRKGPKMRQVMEKDEDLDLKLDVPVVQLNGRTSIEKLVDQFNHGLGGRDRWVDMTGLSGVFEIKLRFSLDVRADSPLAQKEDFPGEPKLPEALEQQLGLRVELRRAPTDVVVVDHVERTPIDN